jgi:hypothetical protein
MAKCMKIPAHAQAARANSRVIIRKNDSIRAIPIKNNEIDIKTYFNRVKQPISSYM